jgi:phenylalanyl-tRNA synthetase beta chain
VRLPYHWLCELVKAPGDPESIAAALALRGFEVASVQHGDQPVIDFEITANRPDCLSVIGLAREASAAFGVPLRLPDRALPPAGQPQPIDVTIEDPELCPRYCAQVFEVRANGHTPDWMRERLEACGVRSISPIVDVTNYVMLETGQPTHAFDYAKLAGRALRIRRTAPGEKVTTLDGVERALEPDMLVIADTERPQAIAGVMGGAHSEIGAATKLMVLESACFKPSSVRRTSKKLALKTEASTRFERGADIEAAPAAIARIAGLLQQIGAAQPLGPTIDRYPVPRRPLVLPLRASRITRVLGVGVADAEVPARLEPLGFIVARREAGGARREAGGARSEAGDAKNEDPRSGIDAPRTSHLAPREWSVTVPSFRVDVQREIDLIEEIARHDGYASLPATFPTLAAAQPQPDPRTLRDRRLRQLLTACGLSEAMTFAFIEADAAAPFAAADHAEKRPATEYTEHTEYARRATDGGVIAIENPLSEKFAVLRPSLLPGLIDAAAHNRRRQQHDVRLFETAVRFDARGESRAVAGVWAGAGVPAHWSRGATPADFYDMKGVIGTVTRAFGVEAEFEPAQIPYLVPGKSAVVLSHSPKREGGQAGAADSSRSAIGVVGQIQPAIAEARGFPASEPLWAFELDADALGSTDAGDSLRAESLPRFPSIVRDLSILVDAGLPAAAVRGTIRSSAPSELVHVIEFDRYTGKGVPADRVSLSLRLTFRSPGRTLTDAEVDAAMDRIVSALADAHGAQRR